MGLLDTVKKKASEVGRFISTTGKGALRKIGDTAKSIKSFAGKVNEATGGAAGAAWEASKSMPGSGAITTNIEKGLGMAEKAVGWVSRRLTSASGPQRSGAAATPNPFTATPKVYISSSVRNEKSSENNSLR